MDEKRWCTECEEYVGKMDEINWSILQKVCDDCWDKKHPEHIVFDDCAIDY